MWNQKSLSLTLNLSIIYSNFNKNYFLGLYLENFFYNCDRFNLTSNIFSFSTTINCQISINIQFHSYNLDIIIFPPHDKCLIIFDIQSTIKSW